MEFNGSTFVLELINFLVLIWILKRVLYAPVMKTIADRRRRVQETLANAEQLRAGATALQEQYNARLQAWEAEREARRGELERELAGERARQLKALEASLAREREKLEAREAVRAAEALAAREGEAVAFAGRFASRLLRRLAGPELEARILALFLEELRTLPEERARAARNGLDAHSQLAQVTTAFPLAPSGRQAVVEALHQLAGRPVKCTFVEDPELVAGVLVSAGPLVLEADLRHELQLFAEVAQHGG